MESFWNKTNKPQVQMQQTNPPWLQKKTSEKPDPQHLRVLNVGVAGENVSNSDGEVLLSQATLDVHQLPLKATAGWISSGFLFFWVQFDKTWFYGVRSVYISAFAKKRPSRQHPASLSVIDKFSG